MGKYLAQNYTANTWKSQNIIPKCFDFKDQTPTLLTSTLLPLCLTHIVKSSKVLYIVLHIVSYRFTSCLYCVQLQSPNEGMEPLTQAQKKLLSSPTLLVHTLACSSVSIVFLIMSFPWWLWESSAIRPATVLNSTQRSLWKHPSGRKN